LGPVDIVTAATRLAELLAAENAALSAADIPRAIHLVEAKAEALRTLEAMLPAARAGLAQSDEEARREMQALGARLAHELAENRRLLERALHVQRRIIGMIARAMPRALAANAPRYGAKGGIHAQHLRQPIAVSSRV
jgi:hypothetical protein